MASLTFGAFKELYRGSGIYWAGTYNVEGDGRYRTLADARKQIDDDVSRRELREAAEKAAKLAEAKAAGLWAERNGDSVVVHTPDGDVSCTIRAYRNQIVWDLENKYDREIVMA